MRTLKRIAPVQAGKVIAVAYFALGLAVILVMLIPYLILGGAATVSGFHNPWGLSLGLGFFLVAPFLYGAMGFVLGVVGAAVYNTAAHLVGGLEIELE